ncbi:YhjD/YihY/BrkB family envelope integrity protein [Piscinibacter sp. XHJ-5]|uniref:YhjD/YihY/BrkB family envelope integrity protein n=1 Tax=Piscinibacter sp. XHJ-5 TaxID=3037797 RepID=UPI002452808D|nr:YhjD/YihY/BrkB family envelope integrity protein [Piscinibacter sp. XHJ-5]
MNVSKLVSLVKEAANAWVEDRAASMGAALSYYSVFSLAPLLLIVIAVAGLVFGREAAQGAIVGQLQGLLGNNGAEIVQEMLKSVSEPKEGILATVTGLLLLLVGATTVFAELQDDLDRVWKAPARAKPSGLWGWVRSRILSFGMILAIGFLLLVSLVVTAAISALGDWWGPMFGGWETLAQVVNFLLSFGLVTAMFAFIYRFMPHVRIEWRDVWTGAGVTALLFTVGKFVIGLYIGKSSVASGFGAAGSLAVLLLWVYYSAQIFLLGAEFTWVYAHSLGSRREKPAVQEAASSAVPTAAEPASSQIASAGLAAADLGSPARPLARAPVRVDEPEAQGLAGLVQRNLLRAIGVSALLGAGAAIATGVMQKRVALRSWQRRHPVQAALGRRPVQHKEVTPPLRRTFANAHAPSPLRRGRRPTPAGAAWAVAKMVGTVASSSVLAAVLRALKQGWNTRSARRASG